MSSFRGSFSPGSMPFISGALSVPRYPKRISLRRRDSCKMSSASSCTVVYLTLSKSNMSFRYCTIWCCKEKGEAYNKESCSHACQEHLPGRQQAESPRRNFVSASKQIYLRLGIAFVLAPLLPLKQDSRAPEILSADVHGNIHAKKLMNAASALDDFIHGL